MKKFKNPLELVHFRRLKLSMAELFLKRFTDRNWSFALENAIIYAPGEKPQKWYNSVQLHIRIAENSARVEISWLDDNHSRNSVMVANNASKIQHLSELLVQLVDEQHMISPCIMLYLVVDEKFYALILPEHSQIMLLRRLWILQVKLQVLQERGIEITENFPIDKNANELVVVTGEKKGQGYCQRHPVPFYKKMHASFDKDTPLYFEIGLKFVIMYNPTTQKPKSLGKSRGIRLQIEATPDKSASIIVTWISTKYVPRSIEIASAFSNIQHILYYNIGPIPQKPKNKETFAFLLDLVVDDKLFVLQFSQSEDIVQLDSALQKFKAIQQRIQTQAAAKARAQG